MSDPNQNAPLGNPGQPQVVEAQSQPVADPAPADVQQDDPGQPIGGEIRITVSETSVNYDSGLSIPEIIFWMDVVKSMILNRVVTQEGDNSGPAAG